MFGDNQNPDIGKDTQFPHNDPTKGGRKPSLKTAYKEILNETDGILVWVPKEEIKTRTIEGKEEFGIPLDPVKHLLYRLNKLATGKNDRVALDAIKFIWEQMDGKAKITAELEQKPKGSIPIHKWVE